MTTPEQTSPTQDPAAADDDIWADSPPSTTRDNSTNQEVLSDLPSIRRQHMTDGYREGLSQGKAKVMQSGFDEGYPIGVVIGLRAGRVLGVLEGCVAAKGVKQRPDVLGRVERLLRDARADLDRRKLMEGLEDSVVAEAKGVPERVEGVLRSWEERVLVTDELSRRQIAD
ncbi:uncharacterized protein HMPREF1541_09531 [Cyphellophora europaea CBS 101466]|uniref:Protein YAE1 n=1 Tax=Cyphellophora europaea (strain CBS 101466) TaxID=1220924 RepID=W2SCD6_CYPE1|nr:uncharacterized protein HMPREF1541_09531 [Cyphellophora europaea CBS 101466]ETN45698.1 hypothetical protein HMPREF1541_09531 [Cyphellophora europaea CBS 101466]